MPFPFPNHLAGEQTHPSKSHLPLTLVGFTYLNFPFTPTKAMVIRLPSPLHLVLVLQGLSYHLPPSADRDLL